MPKGTRTELCVCGFSNYAKIRVSRQIHLQRVTTIWFVFSSENLHALDFTRAEERKGGETSQLALARCMMRGVLGREQEPLKNGGSKQNFVAYTKFTVTDERLDLFLCRLAVVICIQFASSE